MAVTGSTIICDKGCGRAISVNVGSTVPSPEMVRQASVTHGWRYRLETDEDLCPTYFERRFAARLQPPSCPHVPRGSYQDQLPDPPPLGHGNLPRRLLLGPLHVIQARGYWARLEVATNGTVATLWVDPHFPTSSPPYVGCEISAVPHDGLVATWLASQPPQRSHAEHSAEVDQSAVYLAVERWLIDAILKPPPTPDDAFCVDR